MEAIANLKTHFAVSGNDVLQQSISSTEIESSVAGFFHKWMLDVVDGGISASKLIDKKDSFVAQEPDLAAQLEKQIKIITGEEVNEMVGDQTNPTGEGTKGASTASIILVKMQDATLTNRFTSACSLLMGAIPSYEWSRAVPYLNVVLHTYRSPTNNENKVSAISLGRFLLGEKTIDPDTTEGRFIEAAGYQTEDGQSRTTAGMELFVSPQTLVNADINSGGTLSTPAIDPFRPLISIKSFELSIISRKAGIEAYKSGKLNLLLHDRSRMADVADLLKPDSYALSDIMIEYGWSHPDGGAGSSNVFGQMINASRVREKYGVSNMQLSFLEGGQVDISLDVWTKGLNDLTTSKIAETASVSDGTRVIEKLIDEISTYREKIISTKGKRAEIFGPQVLNSVSDISKSTQLPSELAAKINEMIQQKTQNKDSEPDPEQLLAILDELLGPSGNGSDGVLASPENSLVSAFDNKMSSLSNGNDPVFELLGSEEDNNLRSVLGEDFESRYVSLGKLLTLFVSTPLMATGQYDEVQFLTYNFGQGAGAIRKENISCFPVKISDFKTYFTNYTNQRGQFNLSVDEFLKYMISNFLDDFTNQAYGMSIEGLETKWDIEEGQIQNRVTLGEIEEKGAVYDQIQTKMESWGIPNGEFIPPQIKYFLESVPKRTDSAINLPGDDNYTILRIHVFDETASRYSSYMRFLETLSNRHVGTADADDADIAMYKAAAEEKLGTFDTASSTFTFNDGITPQDIKNMVSSRVPYLRYGTSASGIIAANVQTKYESLLSTDHIQKVLQGDPTTAPGVDGGTVPLRVFPAQIDLTTMGCPFFSIGQQFFVDMDTGTTIDNIYGVVEGSMIIEPGKFETTVRLSPMMAYGTYRSTVAVLKSTKAIIEKSQGDEGG